VLLLLLHSTHDTPAAVTQLMLMHCVCICLQIDELRDAGIEFIDRLREAFLVKMQE